METGLGVSFCPSGSFYRHFWNLSEVLQVFRPFEERLKHLKLSPPYSLQSQLQHHCGLISFQSRHRGGKWASSGWEPGYPLLPAEFGLAEGEWSWECPDATGYLVFVYCAVLFYWIQNCCFPRPPHLSQGF